MTTTINKLITVGECREIIDDLANGVIYYGEDYSISGVQLDNLVYGVENNLQLRDYLMGLPLTWSLEDSCQIVEFILENSSNEVPFLTVLSAFYYERGMKKESAKLLNNALKLDPKYSLANRLVRVVALNWDPSLLATMREESHAKVIKNIAESSSEKVSA